MCATGSPAPQRQVCLQCIFRYATPSLLHHSSVQIPGRGHPRGGLHNTRKARPQAKDCCFFRRPLGLAGATLAESQDCLPYPTLFQPSGGRLPHGWPIPLIPESLLPPAMRLFASMLLTALHAFDAREGCDPRGNTTVVDILTRDPSFPCAAPRPGGWAWAGYPWLHRKPPPPSARRSILNPVRSAAGRKARALLLPP